MRILNIAINDWANYSHDNANALRSIGIDCRDACFHPSPFNYATQSLITNKNEITRVRNSYDIIQVFHTDPTIYNLVKDHPKVIIYHTGTRYRQQPDFHDKIFKGRKIATDQCEFLFKQHMDYIAPHVNHDIKHRQHGKKLIIGHYPSNPESKNTKKIQSMLSQFKNDFEIRIDVSKMNHQEHLKRVAQCDIYIELFNPIQNGKPYGCFGTSAFEATALGCLVVTNNINPTAYEDVYSQQPFLTPNTEQDFIAIIKTLKDITIFEQVKKSLHDGFYDKHSIKATGKRIKEVIL